MTRLPKTMPHRERVATAACHCCLPLPVAAATSRIKGSWDRHNWDWEPERVGKRESGLGLGDNMS